MRYKMIRWRLGPAILLAGILGLLCQSVSGRAASVPSKAIIAHAGMTPLAPIHALCDHGRRQGIAALCIGGGEAVAMMIEEVNRKKHWEMKHVTEADAR